jgi:hypothetical protein
MAAELFKTVASVIRAGSGVSAQRPDIGLAISLPIALFGGGVTNRANLPLPSPSG